MHSDPRSIGKTAAVCTVEHPQGSLSNLVPCGKPARWALRFAYVCAECRLLLAHMPRELFQRVAS